MYYHAFMLNSAIDQKVFFSVYLNNKKNTSSSLYQNLDGRNKYIQTITFSFLFAEKKTILVLSQISLILHSFK